MSVERQKKKTARRFSKRPKRGYSITRGTLEHEIEEHAGVEKVVLHRRPETVIHISVREAAAAEHRV